MPVSSVNSSSWNNQYVATVYSSNQDRNATQVTTSQAPVSYATHMALYKASLPTPAQGVTSAKQLVRFQQESPGLADRLPNAVIPAANTTAGAADSISE